jgi:hypothetical protein
MRKISTEAAIGLALELLVIILHRFHLREVRITWGIFELGVFLIGDTIARGSWAETIFHPERRRRKRIRVGIAAGIVSVFFGCWVVRLPLEATATAAPPTKEPTNFTGKKAAQKVARSSNEKPLGSKAWSCAQAFRGNSVKGLFPDPIIPIDFVALGLAPPETQPHLAHAIFFSFHSILR